MEWLGIIVRGLFYTLLIAFMFPWLILFRVDERHPKVDDGVDLDYDDNDPGKDIDGTE